jgi:hypothetical protein
MPVSVHRSSRQSFGHGPVGHSQLSRLVSIRKLGWHICSGSEVGNGWSGLDVSSSAGGTSQLMKEARCCARLRSAMAQVVPAPCTAARSACVKLSLAGI